MKLGAKFLNFSVVGQDENLAEVLALREALTKFVTILVVETEESRKSGNGAASRKVGTVVATEDVAKRWVNEGRRLGRQETKIDVRPELTHVADEASNLCDERITESATSGLAFVTS